MLKKDLSYKILQTTNLLKISSITTTSIFFSLNLDEFTRCRFSVTDQDFILLELGYNSGPNHSVYLTNSSFRKCSLSRFKIIDYQLKDSRLYLKTRNWILMTYNFTIEIKNNSDEELISTVLK